MPELTCDECKRLLRAYQTATVNRVLLDQAMAGPHADPMEFSRAVAEAEAAEVSRAEAKLDIDRHRAETGHE